MGGHAVVLTVNPTHHVPISAASERSRPEPTGVGLLYFLPEPVLTHTHSVIVSMLDIMTSL